MSSQKSNITFRPANSYDADLIFSWSNDPVVRQQSYNSAPIAYDNHIAWFSEKLTSENAVFLIAITENSPAALVRFDKNEDETVIGILMDAAFRGRGLATSVLSGAVATYLENREAQIFAYIKKENVVSIKTFAKAGFYFQEETMVHGFLSVKYVFDKDIKAKTNEF